MLLTPNRRALVTGGLAAASSLPAWTALAAAPAGIALGAPRPFSFDGLKRRAQALAGAPYAPAPIRDAEILQSIDYDAYGQIAFRRELTLWSGVAGAQPVRLFAQGRYFKEPVAIYTVAAGVARQVVYSADVFATPPGHPLRRLTGGGFAGFRLLNPGKASDWMAFLGASYFRAAEPFDQYGASARGLAINSGGPAQEEFPRFSAFWLEQDGHGGLISYALLEGASVAGAFRIANRRGPDGAVQDIKAALYFRRPVETLGLAPLTSMFWFGENTPGPRQDWRPEVHDSDGLSLWTGAGERIWRPLTDPPRVTTNAFADTAPKGFGLIQRDRGFEDYQDDSVFYEKRPSLWVEPLEAWGAGAVRLVELPTTDETNDNIVAFWTPERPVTAGAVIETRYRLHWEADDPSASNAARVVATRLGAGGRPGQPPRPGVRKFVVDWQGAALDGLSRASGVEPAISASRGRISEAVAYPVVGTRRWRMMFELSDAGDQPADLRAFLRRGKQALSETWLYQAFP